MNGENRFWALVVFCVCTLFGLLGYAWYEYASARAVEHHALRKIYVEQCKMTPAQAEQLIPGTAVGQ